MFILLCASSGVTFKVLNCTFNIWFSISENKNSGIYMLCKYLGTQSSSSSQVHLEVSPSKTPSNLIASQSTLGKYK